MCTCVVKFIEVFSGSKGSIKKQRDKYFFFLIGKLGVGTGFDRKQPCFEFSKAGQTPTEVAQGPKEQQTTNRLMTSH